MDHYGWATKQLVWVPVFVIIVIFADAALKSVTSALLRRWRAHLELIGQYQRVHLWASVAIALVVGFFLLSWLGPPKGGL